MNPEAIKLLIWAAMHNPRFPSVRFEFEFSGVRDSFDVEKGFLAMPIGGFPLKASIPIVIIREYMAVET